MLVWGEIAVIVLLTLANALFAGAEVAILSVRKSRLVELAERNGRAARAVLQLREEPEQFLATVQVAITLIGTAAAAFGGATLGDALAASLIGTGMRASLAEDVALITVVAAISYLSVVIGELVPKSLALRSGEHFALLAGRPILLLSRVLRPLVWGLTASANLVLRPFRDTTKFTESRFSREELQQLLEEAATAGSIAPRAASIASRALDFQHIHINAVMVPRQAMVRIDRDATWEQTWQLLVEHGHTRMLVSSVDSDHILGYVTSRDLLVAKSNGTFSIKAVLRPIEAVPESARATDVLTLMQTTQALIVLVVDEHGGVSGLVTLEDLIEELVGEIFEEHETKTPTISHEGPGKALVDGATPVHELNRELGLALPTSPEWVTIGGLILARARDVPSTGTSFTLEDGTHIDVVQATERKVVLARITWTPESLTPSVRPADT